MIELIVNGAELQTLAEKGMLNDLIKSCTYGSDEAVEEKPKKKKATRKKKEEKPAAEAESFQEALAVADPAVPPMAEPIPTEPTTEEAPTEAVPSAAPVEALNLEALAQKAIGLMDTGKGAELQALLQKYNANSLPELQPEQYSAFYADLQSMEG